MKERWLYFKLSILLKWWGSLGNIILLFVLRFCFVLRWNTHFILLYIRVDSTPRTNLTKRCWNNFRTIMKMCQINIKWMTHATRENNLIYTKFYAIFVCYWHPRFFIFKDPTPPPTCRYFWLKYLFETAVPISLPCGWCVVHGQIVTFWSHLSTAHVSSYWLIPALVDFGPDNLKNHLKCTVLKLDYAKIYNHFCTALEDANNCGADCIYLIKPKIKFISFHMFLLQSTTLPMS